MPSEDVAPARLFDFINVLPAFATAPIRVELDFSG
jgi:hypothetical protein